MKNAKYKVGDMVILEPYDKFIDHMAIDETYWKSQMHREMTVIEVIRSSQFGHYYYLHDVRYAWSEEFIRYSNNSPLEDALFEI